MDPFPHTERIVAGRLGLSRNQIRAARQAFLQKDVHWIIGKNRTLMLNDAGLKILADSNQLPPPPSAAPVPAEKIAVGESSALGVGDFITFRVLRHYPMGNRHYIDAKPEGLADAPTWRVKIHPDACELFLPGMQFEAVFVRHLVAECRRRPRRKGRW